MIIAPARLSMAIVDLEGDRFFSVVDQWDFN
jgi:hypothetical protein